MITEIEIERFKSFRKVKLSLGHFNLFIGANASGKSNFLDALRVLQGIGYGFTVDEIFNGKPKSAGSEVWEAIRGGSARAVFVERGAEAAPTDDVVDWKVRLRLPDGRVPLYRIFLMPSAGLVREEALEHVYGSGPFTDIPDTSASKIAHYTRKGSWSLLPIDNRYPVLHQFLRYLQCREDDKKTIEACIRALSNMQRLDPSPPILREYSRAPAVKRMGERGENFAALVKTILKDEGAKSAYLSWLTRLTPTELTDVTVLSGALGEPLFALKENGTEYPAPILSDGTLRFAAIAAAFFQPDMPDILTIEEVENSIHPSRLRLLVELLKSQSRSTNRQVIATTHSPIVLAWLTEEDYKTTFFCKRDEETGESIIKPLTEIADFLKVVRKQPISDLFAEGWLEGAL